MKKQASLVVIAAACAALLAGPAMAQMSGGDNMKGMKMSSAPKKGGMKMAKGHAMMKHTCMDYAWESQDQKDCTAGKMKPPTNR